MYKNLKAHQYETKPLEAKTSVMKSSASIQRLKRELSPKKYSPPRVKREEAKTQPIPQAKGAGASGTQTPKEIIESKNQ